MQRKIVLVTELPRMLRGIIHELLSVEEMIVVDAVAGLKEVLERMDRSRVDVVVLGLDDSRLLAAGEELFERNPDLTILGVTEDGRWCFLYELRPCFTSLGEASPEALLHAILSTPGSAASRSGVVDRAAG